MSDPDPASHFYQRETLANPFSLMAKLRNASPIVRTVDPAGREIFLVTQLALIEYISKRTDLFSNDFGSLFFAGNEYPEVAEILAKEPLRTTLLLANDEPDHKRYRALVNAVFATGRVSHLAPIIETLVDQLIDDFIEKGHCNFVDEFAVLLPIYIIADILGLPRDEYDKVKRWSDAVVTLVGRTGTKEDEIHAAGEIVAYRRYLREAVAARRTHPRDDLLSNLVAVRLDGVQPLDDMEATALAFEIAVAGNETTRNTLMSGMAQLLQHPNQMQALINEPSLIDNAIEEILRFETPVSSMWRVARQQMTLGGIDIPAGATLLLRFDGGNRDPARFEDPDRFEVRRPNARTHVAFGAPSIHRCLGQMLARKELLISFRQLLARLHNMRISEESDIDYQPSLFFHTISSLSISFDPMRCQTESTGRPAS